MGDMQNSVEARPSRILLVEDEESLCIPLQCLLEDEGYTVSRAENGVAALRSLHSQVVPDLIILDLHMPVMNGWQFRAAQRQDPGIADVPVLAISCDSSPQAATIHADGFFGKPLDLTAFLAAVRKVSSEGEKRRRLAPPDAEDRMASLGKLAACVGHEINNPLAFVLLNVELAHDQLNSLGKWLDEPEREKVVETLDVSNMVLRVLEMLSDCSIGLDRMRAVVENLQRVARTPSTHQQVIDVEALLDESISIAWNWLRHRAKVTRKYVGTPRVFGERAALGQVFLNLIMNAAQAIPDGHAENNEVAISALVNGDEIFIEVRDTGGGISAENLPHIFDPFFTTKLDEGTGLGLAISRQIIVQHRGRVIVNSQMGKGTAVKVVLPLYKEDVANKDHSPAKLAEKVELRKRRILVIDDEPLLTSAMQRSLKEQYSVVAVNRAKQALDRIRAGEQFDLILCDLMMPEMSGSDLYEELATHWPALLPKVVMATGGAFTPSALAFLEQHPLRIIHKPFSMADLLDAVSNFLTAGQKTVAGVAPKQPDDNESSPMPEPRPAEFSGGSGVDRQ